MIWESAPWKQSLLRQVKEVQRWTERKRWSEASLAHLEQSVMISFYSIRKLMEAKKLSNSTLDLRTSLRAYACQGKQVTLMNWHKVDSLFDLENPQAREVKLPVLCNQFVHSYVFLPFFSEQGLLKSVLVSSERTRMTELYEVELTQIMAILDLVGNDYPNEISMSYEEAKGDYSVTARML